MMMSDVLDRAMKQLRIDLGEKTRALADTDAFELLVSTTTKQSPTKDL